MKLDIALKSKSSREEQVKNVLLTLVEKYNIEKSIYNNRILIDEKGTNNATPLITLNTRHLNNPGQLLAQFLHLQMRCFLNWRRSDAQNAIESLEEKLPGHTREDYMTLIACYLELEELKKLVGEHASTILANKEENPEIYVLVLDEHERIKPIITQHKLLR